MGDLRKGETDRFQIKGGNWYLIVFFEKGQIQFRVIPSSAKNNLETLARDITLLGAKHVPFKIIGVWHGKYRTDLFLLDKNTLKQRLKEEFGIECTLEDIIREKESWLAELYKIRKQF